MASKRKFNVIEKSCPEQVNKKHSLDSDEEDSDDYDIDKNSDNYVEGEEDGVEIFCDNVKITPFNMREELQEGQFDKDGQYHWHKVESVKDNWMDNIDWVKINDKRVSKTVPTTTCSKKSDASCNEFGCYKQILPLMKKNEMISQTLQRLGRASVKLSTIDRINRKKRGVVDEDTIKIEMLTEIVNNLLNITGNMNVYQLTFEDIEAKLKKYSQSIKSQSSCLDMYSDDFGQVELKSMNKAKSDKHPEIMSENNDNKVLWEFKWNQQETSVEGPYDTKKMIELSTNGHFKNGVYVRKVGDGMDKFYTSKRIDFDLYL